MLLACDWAVSARNASDAAKTAGDIVAVTRHKATLKHRRSLTLEVMN